MLETTSELKQQMKALKITEMAKALDDLLLEAEAKELSYQQFLSNLLVMNYRNGGGKTKGQVAQMGRFPGIQDPGRV